MKKILTYLNLKKFFLINLFIFLYIFINLLDGDRGYFSYIKKNNVLEEKILEEKKITSNLDSFKSKNSMLLKETINLDYLDYLYRKLFVLGKPGEELYLIK
jgi:cell division protein DivIC